MDDLDVSFVIDCFELEEATGAGDTNGHVGFVRTEALAKEWKGGNHYRSYRPFKKTFVVFGSLQSFDRALDDAVRARALQKLTPAERRALGY